MIVSMLAAAGAMGADELPLPAVPAEMTVPTDRAGYILLHFWDAMDFDDADRSLDRDFMGQNMANFLSVFPHARESDRRAAVRRPAMVNSSRVFMPAAPVRPGPGPLPPVLHRRRRDSP